MMAATSLEKGFQAIAHPEHTCEPSPTACQRMRRSRVLFLLTAIVPLTLLWYNIPAYRHYSDKLDGWQYQKPCHHSAAFGKADAALWSATKDGYAGDGAVQRRLEQAFLSVPSPESAREALYNYTTQTHVAGSSGDQDSALLLQRQWSKLLGIQPSGEHVFDAGSADSISYLTRNGDTHPRTWTDTYYVWLNRAQGGSSLKLSPPSTPDNPDPEPSFVANLEEDVIEEDPTSSRGEPVFHGYSKPGAASGPIVYAGLCSIDDFAQLKERGVDVTGAVTLCRYGGPFRGLKVRASALAGAVATLIYSDPLEDGGVTEANGFKPYPEGPARQKNSVQRGSVQGLSFYPGDPGTPNLPSYKNASRLDPELADSLPKIPSLPISFSNAAPLLRALRGSGINTQELEHDQAKWVGQVPGVDEYWSGPSRDVVHVNNDVNSVEVKPIWNTYALIPGHIEDEVVVVGNHRDAWGFGAADPTSGTTALHELVTGFGSLTKKGWKPLRTILIASWDGEEYGLVGSTEFGEDYASWLQDKAVAYLNTDVAAAGSGLKVNASPSLARLLTESARHIQDPEAKDNTSTIEVKQVGPLGSGSDFSVFLQHLGIASSDIGYAFTPANQDAVYHYHSNYDSFYWMERFGDPSFKRITTIAKFLGIAALRMAGNVFLPISVVDYGKAIEEYVKRVEEIAKKAALTERLSRGKPLDFTRLHQKVHGVQQAARHLNRYREHVEKQLKDSVARPKPVPPRKLRQLLRSVKRVNAVLRRFEQHFIHPEGLKDRSWYRSLLVGPGRWTGYGATALPGITEAIRLDGDLDAARREIHRLEEALNSAAKDLKDATRTGRGHGAWD